MTREEVQARRMALNQDKNRRAQRRFRARQKAWFLPCLRARAVAAACCLALRRTCVQSAGDA